MFNRTSEPHQSSLKKQKKNFTALKTLISLSDLKNTDFLILDGMGPIGPIPSKIRKSVQYKYNIKMISDIPTFKYISYLLIDFIFKC